MKAHASPKFDAQYATLPKRLQKLARKQVDFLVENIRHPSLRAKKYHETEDVWQARIDHAYRFYFKINGDTYTLLAIKRHAD